MKIGARSRKILVTSDWQPGQMKHPVYFSNTGAGRRQILIEAVSKVSICIGFPLCYLVLSFVILCGSTIYN